MQKKKTKKVEKPTPVLKNPIIFTVALTLSVLILFASVAGIVIGVRNARSLISIGGVRIDPSAAAYLVSTNKTAFLARHDGYDDPTFFESEYADGVSYGELLRSETEQYLKEIAVGAYLFDNYSSLTRDERKMIKNTAADILFNYGDIDKAEFNRLAAPMDFDYDGFVDALTLIYKAQSAMERIYGSDGAVLRSSGAYAAETEKYLATFAHVKLLFIRTEYEYTTDENGELVRDPSGNYLTRPLTNEEKASREADVAEIRDAITALKNGTDDQMSEEFFNSMLRKYNFDDYTLTGYYFSGAVDSNGVPMASATVAFAEDVSAEVLDLSLSMAVGEYREINTEYGLCFVYRAQPMPAAYTTDTYEFFFTDFYSDAAQYLYFDNLATLSRDVVIKDKYYERIDVVALPYNSKFRLRGGFTD